MREERPWMTRLREKIQQVKCSCDDSGIHLHDDEIDRAIADAAPPVEEMANWLRGADHARHCKRQTMFDVPEMCDCGLRHVLLAYNVWDKQKNQR